MSEGRLFYYSIKLNLSVAEAMLIQEYLHSQGKKGEIGVLLKEHCQEEVEKLVSRATMYADRKESK